ncbi:MAG: alpha/beta hydrolase [Clostridia bacterium]|nr:alpha/beta hydrolase [Clostridia bacterium]
METVMEMKESLWNGYIRLDFMFEDRRALVVCPKTPTEDKRWLFKTEYFGAFPAFELAMLERGYYVAHVNNVTRWCLPEDTDVKARFCDFLIARMGLNKRCVPVGMSCGGMQAVYFGAKYPQYVAALYLDAPVLNLLSCPCGVGAATRDLYAEFVRATGMTVSDLINYRNHPIDHAGELIDAGIPVFLVCGDSDTVVPYVENGKELARIYRERGGVIEEIIKPGCDHHPHGLEDNTPIRLFVEKYYE